MGFGGVPEINTSVVCYVWVIGALNVVEAPPRRLFNAEFSLVGFEMAGFPPCGKLSLLNGRRMEGQLIRKTSSQNGRRYDSGERGARNVLTWGDLGGLGNLAKMREKWGHQAKLMCRGTS